LGIVERRLAHVHQFVGISDQPGSTTERFVASMSHYNTVVSLLEVGHSVPLVPSSALRAYGYVASLILPSDTYAYFEGQWPVFEGVSTTLFAVVPVSAADLKIKRKGGLPDLWSHWDATGRDILHVGHE
jgi:hypothetical protein